MNKRTKTNTIRIIAGAWRGRRIPVLDFEGLRPTTDRVRETVFNWLMHDIAGANCLDLFAGSGVLGLECLSRSASFVQFVEKSAPVADGLTGNLDTLLSQDVDNRASVAQVSALEFLNKPASMSFDMVFLDPPFKSDVFVTVMTLLVDNGWLNEGALVYLEQDSRQSDVLVPANWVLYRQGKAGQSAYFVYST